MNPLDRACKEHDIAYESSSLSDRHEADRRLRTKALQRVKSKDARLGERLAALAVSGIMTGKLAVGAGHKKKRRTTTKRKRPQTKRKTATTKKRSGTKRRTARRVTKKKRTPRMLLTPTKIGGILPFLLPLIAGIGAAGSLAGGAAGIARAVSAAKEAKQKLAELARHNKAMETLRGKTGRGMRLGPWPSEGWQWNRRGQPSKKNFRGSRGGR